MRIGRLALASVGLLILGIGVASAREFRRPNPYDLQPGIREIGRYTQVIPGTYGKLFPLPSLYPGESKVSSAAFTPGCATTPTAPTMGESGSAARKAEAPVHPKLASAPSPKESSTEGFPMGNVLGSAVSNPVDGLENDLRDVARRLNSK